VAGVERLVMTVPTPGGVLNPLVLAAAKMVGIDEIYRVGGAQAIAALAYGTVTILPVDKIVGPGNAYVAAAKRHVFGRVGIDMIAGPSEILVVADRHNDPEWIAPICWRKQTRRRSAGDAHDDDEAFAAVVEAAVERHLKRLPRARIARDSWEAHGAILLVTNWNEAAVLIDRIAPEHLELALEEADALASGFIMRAPYSSGATPPRPSATISADPTMSCRRAEALALPRAWACWISSSVLVAPLR